MPIAKGTKPKRRNSRAKRKAAKRALHLAGCPSPVLTENESPCFDGDNRIEGDEKRKA